MTIRRYAIATAMVMLMAAAAQARSAPPQEEAPGAAAEPVEEAAGPEWWVFSRAEAKHYLIDVNSVVRSGDEVTVVVARVPMDTPAGDYSHTVDTFGIRCNGRQSHVATSSDAFADGVPEAPYDTGEPWESIARDSFDDAIRVISCDDMRPSAPSYASVKAYIDAGRP